MKKNVISLYIFTLIFTSFFSYFFVDQNLSYLKKIYTGIAFVHRPEAVIIYILIIVIFYLSFFYFISLYRKKSLSTKSIKFLIGSTIFILFFSYPTMLSYDIFNYIATSKVAFNYLENPYIVTPLELKGDPVLDFTHASNKTALYGPVWIILTYLPYAVGLNNFILTLFSMKLMVTFFFISTIYLIYKISLNWLAVLSFALNPLVIIETLVSSHNDIVMMFFALLSYYLVKKKRIYLSIIFLVLSIFIKFATLFLIPVYLYLVYITLKKKKVNWDRIYFRSFILMLIVFLLSPFREEMYPWYAIWFYVFIVLNNKIKIFFILAVLFLMGLSLKYVPFMYFGLYNSSTIILRSSIIFLPLISYLLFIFTKNLLYFKNERNI